MILLAVVAMLVVVCGVLPCSLPPNTQFYTPTQRAILAPLVIQARVLNITASRQSIVYKACVRRLRTFKDKTNKPLPQVFCFGRFGPDYLCLADVYRGREYVFFMNDDHTARYDGFPQPAVNADSLTLSLVNQGYCEPRPTLPGACERPRIDQPRFRSFIRILEGENAVLTCPALGTSPMVIKWRKHGLQSGAIHPERQGSIQLRAVGVSDTGSYSCSVYNPAGETAATIRVVVDPKPCGDFMILKTNENKTVSSPNYPRYYPRDKMCTWRLCPAPRQRLELAFKSFGLRQHDSLQIYNECDSVGNGAHTYCSSTSPGVMVSQCHSKCVQVGFSATTSLRPNFEARGFEMVVSSTNKESTGFDYKELYCENDILIKFEPKVIQVSQESGRVIRNYKGGVPRVGEDITLYDSYPLKDLFGCYVGMRYGMEYYIGASLTNGRYRMRFALRTAGSAVPVNFENNLNNYQRQRPDCRSSS